MKLRTWQVAARLQVTRKTAQRYHNRGLLSASRDERGHRWFDAAEVERLRQRIADGDGPRDGRPPSGAVRRGFDIHDTDEL